MKLQKITVWLLLVGIIISVSGCRTTTDSTSSAASEIVESSVHKNYITLLYSSADTFNPYTLKTDVNRQLCKLIYEPLIKLDNEFSPVYSIAKSASLDGKICTVELNSVKFSDGSAVTTQDVIYSYNLAKASDTSYAAKLYEVLSVTESGNTVIFNLTKADPYFINLLDFPIIKKFSDTVTDSDGVLQPPIGCGRYIVSEDKQSLKANAEFYAPIDSITQIKLINAPDSDSVSHYAEIGATDIYYSEIQDGNIVRMSGKKTNVNLNNLVYIGINQNYSVLGESDMRQAISAAIDRQKICSDNYFNNALPATGFFTPVWREVKSVQNLEIKTNQEITIENLEKIGYNDFNKDGLRVNSHGVALRFTLLVNSENRIRVAAAHSIASQLNNSGIGVTVVEKSYDQYLNCLNSGNFQLFLGEIKLTDNMDISAMVTENSGVSFGLKTANGVTDNASTIEVTEALPQSVANLSGIVNGFYNGSNTISDVASVLQSDMPFVPVCYRTGVLFSNEKIENVNGSSSSDIYFSIQSYVVNK